MRSDVSINSSGGGGVPGPGGAVSGSQLGANVQGGSAAGAIIAITGIAWAIHGVRGEERDSYRVPPFATGGAIPPLDESRKVREQDCTKPIEDFSANLKCR